MENNNLPIISESAAKVLAATSISQSLSFCMERKYLEKIDDTNLNPFFTLKEVPTTSKNDVSWLEITQVGKPLEQVPRIVLQRCRRFFILALCPKRLNCFF